MTLGSLLIYLLTGAVIGWLASKIMKSRGGLVRSIIVGIIGGALGGWVAGLLGIGGAGTFSLGGFLISVGGACLLIWLARFVTGR